MRLSIAVIAACVTSAHAFQNTSPFALFSSLCVPSHLQNHSISPHELENKTDSPNRRSDILQTSPQDSLQSAAQVLSTAQSFLATCPTEIYYIIRQISLSPLEFHQDAMPHLFHALSGPAVKSSLVVKDVLGLEDLKSTFDVETAILTACKDQVMFNRFSDGRPENAWELAKEDGFKVGVWERFAGPLSEMREEREIGIRNNGLCTLHIFLSCPWQMIRIYGRNTN